MQIQSDICIIGNGAIGKTAALGFAQAGLTVALIEAPANAKPEQPPAEWDSRVYALNPLAQSLLNRIKVWGALDASRVTSVEAITVQGDGNQHPGRLSFDAYAARVSELAWIVEDRNLNSALDTALQFASNVRRVTATAASLAPDSDGVTVDLANNGTIRTKLLVGADGVHSWVRGQVGIDIAYRPYGQRAIVCNFSCALPHHATAYQWFTAHEGIVALLPLAGQRVSLVWSAPDAFAEVLMRELPEALAARVSTFCKTSLGDLQPVANSMTHAFPLMMLRPQAITASRTALIGDAAHVVHPLAGQGMNLGFADVDALIKAVAARGLHRDCGDSRVLSEFARSRKEQILLMQLTTDGLERLFGTDFEPLRLARNIGMTIVDRLPFLKRRLIAHAIGR
jgi:2-octaprenylphenol hydroxylase